MVESTFRRLRAVGLAVCATLWILPAAAALAVEAEDVQTIAAIVNDEVISDFDLAQRTNLLARASSNDNPSPEAAAQLRKEAMRSLVDERLELQEAKRMGVTVTPQEVDHGMTRLAEHNHMTYDQMRAFFAASGVDLSTLRNQVHAQMAWNRLVSKKFMGRITVSDEQIAAAMQEMKRKADRPERRIAEIVLPVDSPAQDAQVRQTAERLVGEIRGGAQFAAIAHQYSQSGSAALGGDLGWVAAGQLTPSLEAVLDRMSPGDVSDPISIAGTYTIIGFIEQRAGGDAAPSPAPETSGQYALRQLVIPVDATQAGARDTAMARAEQLRTQLKSCDEMASAPEAANPLSGDLGTVAAKDLPPAFQSALAGLDTNQVAKPFVTDDGVHVVMVCGKQAPKEAAKTATGEPDRDAVEQQLTDEQLDMMGRRYLRDLRRDAMIEYRLAEH